MLGHFRALTSLNVLSNNIGKVGAELLGNVWKTHKALKTISGASNELDLEGKLGNDLSVVIVELKYNEALTSLNLASNILGARGVKHLAELSLIHI